MVIPEIPFQGILHVLGRGDKRGEHARNAAELSLPAVLTIDGTDHRIAETIVRNTKGPEPQILTLDSMQSVSAKDIENGTTYLSVMEKDLEVLKQALQPEEK